MPCKASAEREVSRFSKLRRAPRLVSPADKHDARLSGCRRLPSTAPALHRGRREWPHAAAADAKVLPQARLRRSTSRWLRPGAQTPVQTAEKGRPAIRISFGFSSLRPFACKPDGELGLPPPTSTPARARNEATALGFP